MENKIENKIAFLTLAITDTQELIRFTDTKTAIVITILSSYIVSFFIALDKLIAYYQYYSWQFLFFLILFLVTLIICIITTSRIINPTNNPTENINLGSDTKPVLPFFIAPNKHSLGFQFYNSKKHKLKLNLELFHTQINTALDNDIIKSLSYELLKVSFIRNIKNERFNFLIQCLTINTLLFFIAYSFYSIETQNAIDIVEMLKKYQKKTCHF